MRPQHFVMLASAKEELKSSECHVFANLVFISIRYRPERRVFKTDPRNPLPESPVWTLTGIRCWVLIGFQKPGASQVLTSPPPPSYSLLLGKHLPPVLCPPLQPPRWHLPQQAAYRWAGHQGPRWNGRVRGASWERGSGGQSDTKAQCWKAARGWEQVTRNGEKTGG